jgi:hypothetical protein
MDQTYLQKAVGGVLVHGMKATTIAQPADPVTYLARWLLHFRDLEDQWSQFRTDQEHLRADRAEYIQELAAEMMRREQERQEREAEEARRQAEEAARQAAAKQSPEEEEEKHEPPPEDPEASTVYSEISDTF